MNLAKLVPYAGLDVYDLANGYVLFKSDRI